MTDWQVYLRDADFVRQGQVDDFSSLEVVLRFNDIGTWQLELAASTEVALLLTQPNWGIMLVRDAAIVMAGPWTNVRHVKDGKSDHLVVTGADDMIWLARQTVPLPSGPPYTQEHDSRTGVASTVLREYVDVNAGPSAISPRQIPGLSLGIDPLVGSSVTKSARWFLLLHVLQELASSGGVGFRVAQVDQGLEFQVYQPVDRSASVKFSTELGNLEAYDYSVTRPTATYVYVGGGGEGVARDIRERSSAHLITWGRIEGELVDQRQTNDDLELDQAGDEALVEQGPQTTLSITPIDTPQQAFGTHYQLGDKVSVGLGGGALTTSVTESTNVVSQFVDVFSDMFGTTVTTTTSQQVATSYGQVNDLVREVKISLTSEGTRVVPTVGTDHDTMPLFQALRDARRRIINLEGR